MDNADLTIDDVAQVIDDAVAAPVHVLLYGRFSTAERNDTSLLRQERIVRASARTLGIDLRPRPLRDGRSSRSGRR